MGHFSTDIGTRQQIAPQRGACNALYLLCFSNNPYLGLVVKQHRGIRRYDNDWAIELLLVRRFDRRRALKIQKRTNF